MLTKKPSQLPQLADFLGADLLMVERGGIVSGGPLSALLAFLDLTGIQAAKDDALEELNDTADDRIAEIAGAAGAGFYDDVAGGIGGTVDGQFFLVKGDGANTYALLYKNVAEVGTLVASLPSKSAVDAVLAALATHPSWDELEARLRPIEEGLTATQTLGTTAAVANGAVAANNTFILATPIAGPAVLAGIRLYPEATGNVKFKRYPKVGANWGAVVATKVVAVVAGVPLDVTIDDLGWFDLEKDEYIGIYGNGILSFTAGGAPSTPYHTLAGDNVAGGAVGAMTSNVRLEVAIDILYQAVDVAALNDQVSKAGATAEAARSAGETIYYGRTETLVPANYANSIGANSTYDPQPTTTAGILGVVQVVAKSVGAATFLVSSPIDETTWQVTGIPVTFTAANAVLTFTPGVELPAGLHLPEGTRFGWYGANGAGKAGYSDADVSRGPGFYFTCPALATGVVTPTRQTTNVQLGHKIAGEQVATPRKSPDRPRAGIVTDLAFGAAAKPFSVETSGVWTFNAGEALSTEHGFNKDLRDGFSEAWDHSIARFAFMATADGEEVGLFKSPVSATGARGSFFSIVEGTTNLKVYEKWAGGAPVFLENKPLGFTFLKNRLYWAALRRAGRKFIIEVWEDAGSGYCRHVYDYSALSSNEYPIGEMLGRAAICSLAGGVGSAVSVRALFHGTPVANPRVIAHTDSNGAAQYNDWDDGWLQRISASLGFGAMLMSTVGGATSTTMLGRLKQDLRVFSPDAVILPIGTNNAVLATWQDEMAAAREMVLLSGARCIIPHVPLEAVGDLPQQMNDHIRTQGWDTIRLDLATSTDDGVTFDPASLDQDHFTLATHAAQYARAQLDQPRLFDLLAAA